jgi:hypothetical protein
MNVVICRTSVRSVFTVISTHVGGSIARNPQIATACRMGGSTCFAGLFLDFNVFAVGAGCVFATSQVRTFYSGARKY